MLGMLVMEVVDKEIVMVLGLKSVIQNQEELDILKLKKMQFMFVQDYCINMD